MSEPDPGLIDLIGQDDLEDLMSQNNSEEMNPNDLQTIMRYLEVDSDPTTSIKISIDKINRKLID